jgi:LmbE family N-acetylglucosaminyl deacetylase
MPLNPEHILLPFAPADLPPGPWLVFAPHADDETFGMGGSLLKASKQGVETHVIVLTDGALGGERDDLVQIRRQEAEAAAQLLGLTSLECWSEPDRGLEQSAGLSNRIAEAIIGLAPVSVFFPGPMEIHPDHRATGFAVWEALQQLYQKHKYKTRAIAYEISVQNPINFCIDITADREEKEAVMAVYASQNSENNYPELVLALNKSRTLSLPPEVGFAEGFFQFSEKDLNVSLREMTHHMINLYQ